jgi:glucose/mannose-6-phosphate isomerase
MKELIATFTKQLTEGIAIGEKAIFTQPKNEIRNVIITGLGGSGIGGSIIAQVTEKEIKVPVLVLAASAAIRCAGC